MKIGIVSDSHDRADALASAVFEAVAQGALAIIHCGDLIGGHTLRPAMEAGVPLHLVHGNNLGDPHALHRLATASGGRLHYHGVDLRVEWAGRRIFAMHYPEYGYAMACTGDFDLVCSGHSHEARIDRVANVKGGTTVLVNPGTVAGIGAPATFAMGDLATMQFEVRSTPSMRS